LGDNGGPSDSTDDPPDRESGPPALPCRVDNLEDLCIDLVHEPCCLSSAVRRTHRGDKGHRPRVNLQANYRGPEAPCPVYANPVAWSHAGFSLLRQPLPVQCSKGLGVHEYPATTTTLSRQRRRAERSSSVPTITMATVTAMPL